MRSSERSYDIDEQIVAKGRDDVIHLAGFASMPDLSNANASSVLPVLFVHAYAMNLRQSVRVDSSH